MKILFTIGEHFNFFPPEPNWDKRAIFSLEFCFSSIRLLENLCYFSYLNRNSPKQVRPILFEIFCLLDKTKFTFYFRHCYSTLLLKQNKLKGIIYGIFDLPTTVHEKIKRRTREYHITTTSKLAGLAEASIKSLRSTPPSTYLSCNNAQSSAWRKTSHYGIPESSEQCLRQLWLRSPELLCSRLKFTVI